jgi:hypothetical protein
MNDFPDSFVGIPGGWQDGIESIDISWRANLYEADKHAGEERLRWRLSAAQNSVQKIRSGAGGRCYDSG